MRAYEKSHPWITFSATDLNDLGPREWIQIGEAKSKCEHLAGTPLKPDIAQRLYEVTLVKGALATTAIEGNTLTEEQVDGIYRGTYTAPPSRQYQEREVRNVLDALTNIATQVRPGESPKITTALICEYNRRLLEGTDHEPDVIPGELRTHSVAVGNYRGAPAEDCAHLLDLLAKWLESEVFESDDPELAFALQVAAAVYAHLYLAWIHPFGDGNGRTGRLVEFLILARSGMVPLPAALLLSNHYNLTRDRYYRELAEASRTSNTRPFLAYAVQGLVDGVREQIDTVRRQQIEVSWENLVNGVMEGFPPSPSRDRKRSLVLAMESGRVYDRAELTGLNPLLAAAYARTGERTLSRDLNRLAEAELIIRSGRGWQANDSIILAFLPPNAAVKR